MGVDGQCHVPVTSPPGKRTCSHCKGWVVLQAGLDRCKKSHPQGNSIPGLFSTTRVAKPTAVSQPTLNYLCEWFE